MRCCSVQAWIGDATQNNNVIADTLLQQVYRWISNPDGQLHDSGIHRAIAGLMQRLFLGLVVEMKRLGADLVAAEFGKILINTKKRNLGAAGNERGRAGTVAQHGTCYFEAEVL
jgi:DNA polymerase epsilon subunit 1